MKKVILILLTLCLLITTVSCSSSTNKNQETNDTSKVTDATTETEEDSGINFLKSNLKDIKIVYSTNLSEEAISKVNSFVEDVNTFCNIEMVVTSDFIIPTNNKLKEWENEILIGLTNRKQSSDFSSQLRGKDYGYGIVDGKIVICGGNDQATIEAMSAFLVDVVVAHKNDTLFYSSKWDTLERYSYEVEEILLNGNLIQSYEIFYPASGTIMEKQMAEAFVNSIQNKTGIELTCKPDSEAKTKEYAILFGKTKYSEAVNDTLDSEQGCIFVNEKNVIVYAKDAPGLVAAEKCLIEKTLTPTDNEKKISISINEPILTIKQTDYSVMTFNIRTADMNVARMKRVLSTITKYMPDIIGLQEANPNWMTYLKENLSDYYEFVGNGREGENNGEYTPILYSKYKFNLIDSGTKWLSSTPDTVSKMAGAEYYRIFTYAVLENKQTGERFLQLNTHLDTAGSEIRVAEVKVIMQFLADYNDMRTIFTGDMNSILSSKELTMVQNRNFATVNDFTELAHSNVIGKSSRLIDYIFVTKNIISLTSYTTDNVQYNGDYASDHFAYYATFKLNNVEGKIDNGWDVEINDYPDEWLDIDKDKENFGQFIFVH